MSYTLSISFRLMPVMPAAVWNRVKILKWRDMSVPKTIAIVRDLRAGKGGGCVCQPPFEPFDSRKAHRNSRKFASERWLRKL